MGCSVQRGCVRFEFVGYGDVARAVPERADRLWIDVGNQLRPGVIDQHHLAAYAGSTASLVLAHPELALGAIDPVRASDAPFVVVLHEHPDLDAVAASYLALELITRGAFPAGAESLASYLDGVDQGVVGLSQDNPFSLYAAHMVVAHRNAQRTWRDHQQQWRRTAEEGLQVVEHALKSAAASGKSLDEVDAFDTPEVLGPPDRREVQADLARYERKLADPRTQARCLKLSLPGQLGGAAEVDALCVRDVQNADDPDRVMFFKDWARTDRRRSSGGGFVALSVFHTRDGPQGRRRCILSVRPDSRRSLRGLGARLDEAEAEARRRLHGLDDRVEDPVTHEPKLPRPGYSNADPWYDGRSHKYTIVDSPRSGTALEAEEIERIFVAYGQGAGPIAPLELPQPGDLSGSVGVDPVGLERLTTVARAGLDPNGPRDLDPAATAGRELDVFISYPRTKLAWVEEHVYAPLRALGRHAVFFDKDSLKAGMQWPAALADGVERCRLFLAVYCPDYFRSSFCQWELQLAIVRDPIATRRIIVPLGLEDVALPAYCSLIQAHPVPRVGAAVEVIRIVTERLGG